MVISATKESESSWLIPYKVLPHIVSYSLSKYIAYWLCGCLCKSMVSCQKGPTRHTYAWQIGPFWQDTLEILCTRSKWRRTTKSKHLSEWSLVAFLGHRTSTSVCSKKKSHVFISVLYTGIIIFLYIDNTQPNGRKLNKNKHKKWGYPLSWQNIGEKRESEKMSKP